MKILVAVDASSSFTEVGRWEHTKKIVNETVNALSKTTDVELVKVQYNKLVNVTLEEFNKGWNFEYGDGGGLNEKLLNGLDYDQVHFITDGFADLKVFDPYVSVLILEDPDYVEDPNPIVGFVCLNCGKEKNLHQAKDGFCPEKKNYFSKVNKFIPDPTKPIRRFTI